MDDELQQLEAELKRLHPVAPSPGLYRRIAGDLTSPVGSGRRVNVSWLWAVGLPAAAAVAIVLLPIRWHDTALPGKSATPANVVPGEQLKPVAVENILYSAEDEGLVTLDDGTPARRERLNFIDTITWKNPHTKASLTWKVPREEVRVVPVSYQ